MDEAVKGLEKAEENSEKTSREIGKRFSEAVKKGFSKMGDAVKTHKADSKAWRKNIKEQRKSSGAGFFGIAANQMNRGYSNAASNVKGFVPTSGSDMFLVLSFILHFLMVFSTGVHPSDSLYFSTNIVIGFLVYFFVVKRVGGGSRGFNGYDFAKTMSFAVVVIYSFYLFKFISDMTNGYGGITLFQALFNPVMHPLWTYYIIAKRETPFSNKVLGFILFFWVIWFLVLYVQFQDDTMYESVVSAENLITAREMVSDVGSFITKAMMNLGKLPDMMRNFTDRSIAHATGGLYVGQVEQNKRGPLGVYLGELEGADPEFYTDEPVTVWATLSGQSLMDNHVDINITCNATNNKYLGEYISKGRVFPSEGFRFRGLLEEYLDCRFNKSQLRSSVNTVAFYASFNFDTMSYLKTYLIDRERLREMTREGIEPLADYSDKDPLAVYTSGPIAIGMGTNTPPIAVSAGSPLQPKLGITIENRWEGRLREIDRMIIQTPLHMTIARGDCDQTHPFDEVDDDDPEYHTYQLSDVGKKKLAGIEGYSQPIKCRLTVHPDILGPTPVTTKYIRVNISYVYEIYDSIDIDVKFRKDKEEETTSAYSKYFSDCTITSDAVYDSTQGTRIVEEAESILADSPTFSPYGYKDGGYDNSGLIWAVMSGVGLCGFTEERTDRDPAATVRDLSKAGKPIIPHGKDYSESQLKPGDVLFFDIKEQWGVPDHAAIYVGNGQIIDARDYVDNGVEVTDGGVEKRDLTDIKLGGSDPKDFKKLFYQANRYAYTRPPLCKNKGENIMPRIESAYSLDQAQTDLYDENGRDGNAENFRNFINSYANANDISSPLLAAVLSKASGFGTDLSVKVPGGIGVAGCKDANIFQDIEQIQCAAETLSQGYAGKTRSGTKSDEMEKCKEDYINNDQNRWKCVLSNYEGFTAEDAAVVWGLYTHWYNHICLEGQGTVADFGNDIFMKDFTRKAGETIESEDLDDIYSITVNTITIIEDPVEKSMDITQEFSAGGVSLHVDDHGWHWSNPFFKYNIVSIDTENVTFGVQIKGYAAETKRLREDEETTIWGSFITAEYDPPPLNDPNQLTGSHDIHLKDTQDNDVCTLTFTEIGQMMECGIPGFRAKVLETWEGEETFNNDYIEVQFFYDPKVT